MGMRVNRRSLSQRCCVAGQNYVHAWRIRLVAGSASVLRFVGQCNACNACTIGKAAELKVKVVGQQNSRAAFSRN